MARGPTRLAAPAPSTLHRTHRSLPAVNVTVHLVTVVAAVAAVLSSVTHAVQIPPYEFQLDLYDNPVHWQKCPEGWKEYGGKCYKVFLQPVSWRDADKVCQSLGGSLAEVEGFNQNKALGGVVMEAFQQTQAQATNRLVDVAGQTSQRIWIGFKRDKSGNYVWANGKPGLEKQGLWDKGNPPAFSDSNSFYTDEQCCDISLNPSNYGDFRWTLGACEEKQMFMCETAACEVHQFRCGDGHQCVCDKCICDGQPDCDDGTDEINCVYDKGCGGNLEGNSGTFQTPGYPGPYPKHSACVWRVRTPVGTKVQLKFESFNVELKYDSVQVFDGSERMPDALLGTFQGNSIPVLPLASSNVLLVIFTSDLSNQQQGFNATWSAVSFDGQTCGGQLTGTSQVQWFSSPLFPAPYPDNLVCDWVITSASANSVVTLQFEELELQSQNDWVEVRDGPSDTSSIVQRTSAAVLPKIVISTSSSLFVRFRADVRRSSELTVSQKHKGFSAKYSSGCNVEMTSGAAAIESPSYGVGTYISNMDCVWRVVDPQGRQSTLVFDDGFDTEPFVDIVKVYRSSHESEESLAVELSGRLSPDPVVSSHGAFVIRFTTDGAVERTGWAATISYDCESLLIRPPLKVSRNTTHYGASVQFSCDEGYKLDGPESVFCGTQGLWYPSTLPTCTLIDCRSPGTPANGFLLNLSGTTFGERAEFGCQMGYHISGQSASTCNTSGWTELPECKEIYCPKEPPPTNGTTMAESNVYGSVREFFCSHGFRMAGFKFSHCTAEGEWSSPVPQCHLLQCHAILGVNNGHPVPTEPVRIGEKVNVTCNPGYFLDGDYSLVCMGHLDYDKAVPVCRDVNECENGDPCGEHTCQNQAGGFRCLCNSGYQHPGKDETICVDINECLSENGGCSNDCHNFDGSYMCHCKLGHRLYDGDVIIIDGVQLVPGKTCIATCSPLAVVNGTVVYLGPPLPDGDYIHPTRAIVSCPPSTIPDGPAELQCRVEGGWAAQVTRCRASTCPSLDTPIHGQVSSNVLNQGSMANYSCDEGFRLVGLRVRFCQRYEDPASHIQEFVWTGGQPRCQAVNCGIPPEPVNGTVFYARTTFRSVATYSCLCGYQLQGTSSRTCQSNGVWSGDVTTCNVQSCRFPGIPLYGSMLATWETFPVGSHVHFRCDRPDFQLSDPWPLECMAPQSYQVSDTLPVYRVSASSVYVAGDWSTVSDRCASYYEGTVVRRIRQLVPELQRLCKQDASLQIAVSNNTNVTVSGYNIIFNGWMEVSTGIRDYLPSVCQCGSDVASALSQFFSSAPHLILEPSQELGCAAAFLEGLGGNGDSLGWSCPLGLELRAGEGSCGHEIPTCLEACVHNVTTASPISTATSTLPEVTSPSPSSSTTATIKMTTSLPPTTQASISSPTTTTDTSASDGSYPETSSDATVKDITVKSTTITPPVISGVTWSTLTTHPSSVAWPIFLIEVEDTMEGSFRNITCIDEVHLNINSKVNEVLRNFVGQIGKGVCRNASDITLELKSGNIRFIGTKATIFIQFCLKYTTSGRKRVESCAEDFKLHVLNALPTKFELVSSQVVPESCQEMSYVPGRTNITRTTWDCPQGYELDLAIFMCSRSALSSFSTIPAATPTPSSIPPPIPVDIIPRMVLTFEGIFEVNSNGASRITECLPEYRVGLLALLSDLEPYVQKYHDQCDNIYVDITANLNLTRHGNRINAISEVILVPLANTIELPALHLCGGFLTGEFQHPLNHLPNVTLPESYLVNCSSITLAPQNLISQINLVTYTCPDGYMYDAPNFLCINEGLPLYSVQVELSVKGTKNSCRSALEESAGTLAQYVVEDVHSRLLSGHLCNTSVVGAKIVLMLRNSTLSLTDSQATISLPFVLLGMDGQSSPVDRCKMELYRYLNTSLAAPVKNMMAALKAKCASAVGSQNYTVMSEEWGCFGSRIYNAQMHTCDKFGALEESITKMKGLMSERRKRETYQQQDAQPYWNFTLPTCIDRVAPVFTGCPHQTVKIHLGPAGPLPAYIPLPNVTDSSGALVTVRYQPPDFQLPYTFRQNMIVNITATDPAGNERLCTISVNLVDITPPEIQCPTGLHRQHYTSMGNTVMIQYPPGMVSAMDYGGISHYIFDPPANTEVYVMQEFIVNATAFDNTGNVATCSFAYVAETDRCPLWTLPTPEFGEGPSCSGTLQGSVAHGLACHVSCKPGYDFISPPEKRMFICVNGTKWMPPNSVPDCAAKSAPNYYLNITQNFTYNGLKSQDCSERVGANLLSQLGGYFTVACEGNLTFQFQHMGSIDIQEQKFTLKMKVTIQQDTGAPAGAAKKCGGIIKNAIDTFKLGIATVNCGNASLQRTSEINGQDSCLPGSILVNETCYECPSGTFLNPTSGSCEDCPIGLYQDQRGQETCKPCPGGTTTKTTATKNYTFCKAKCKPGFFSTSGFEPCLLCWKGSYQPDSGATSCIVCSSDHSTPLPGSTEYADCKALCQPGTFSATGVTPCIPCPVNYYSSTTGARWCNECLPMLVTPSTGSKSIEDCRSMDQCQLNPCAVRATCINRHRYFQCVCPPGFIGLFCNETINECASAPCVNGATCQGGVNSYFCQCPPGYTGVNCELQTDECDHDPCVHGVCVDQYLSYTCHCHSGYTGERCDVDVNECASSPCRNGGVCLDLVGDFQCDCSGTGYGGPLCKKNIDDCNQTTCLNGATCTDLVNGYHCTCAPGFSGENCEHNIDNCRPNPCSNGGFCLDGADSYLCVCKPGYTGPQCQDEVNECSSSPCHNGAACTDEANDFHCHCPAGYKGKRCEQDIDDCMAAPCHANGTAWCEDGVNTFFCHCQEFWNGRLCETQIDPCQTSPCARGATCSVVGQDFVCICPVDVTGTLCDVQIDDCASGPCLNNGSCTDGVQAFSCRCAAGFSGDLCNVNVDECLSRPCHNGASCIDLVNGYACSCASGYKGIICDENIDDCVSQPCRNGGTCLDLVDSFKCRCPPGYKGRTCSVDIDECELNPCQNGGTCIDLTGSYECDCPPSFSGEHCQHDPCVTSNACINGATCVMDKVGMKCQCPPAFTGSDCGKEKPGDYDLQFLGGNGACQPPSLILQEKSRLTVCLWVRFHSQQGGGTYLSLASDNSDSNGYTMLVMSGNIVSVSLSGKVDPQRFELNIVDGKWHHVCYQWSNGRHTVFVDGRLSKEEVYGTDVALPNKLSLRLGHSVNGTSVQSFQGELSQANIYSRPVNASEMEAMGSNCSASRAKGDVYSWAVSDSYLKGVVNVVIPSVCGGTQCPPGFHGDFCNTEIDKIPPTVVSCPSDLSIVNTSVMVQVEWTEPVFQDNIGIMRIQQTHRSGQAFRHGEYMVRYIAYDAENNSAECNFRIIVKPFSCVEPPPPMNGGKVCQTWLHGSFCSVNCWPTFGFVELPPPFYTCGKLGFWDPPRGNPFLFPPCTAMRPPLVSLVGKMEMTGPLCSQQFKAALKSRFSSNMKQLDATLGLCKTDTCDFENGFSVTCDVERKRRRKRSAVSTYHMSINMTLPSNSSALQKENGNWAADAMHTAIKHGQFNDDTFTADLSSLLLTVNYQCQPGQVFRTVEGGTTSRVCLDCPAGYFFSRELNSCELCPVGSYSSQPRQLQCQLCPSNATTAAPGANSSTDCFSLCGAGSYYSRSVCQCISCPAGQYQASPGQTACRNCPLGQTTKGPGAGSIDQCGNLCELGYELSSDGACRPCPVGSYRETHDVPVCGPCPYGWTTFGTGASSVSSCTTVVCKPGLYHTTSNQCAPCPYGTYQPSRGSDTCILCGPGLTTESEGASSRTQCVKGLVDECQMGSHVCHKEALCKDLPDMYSCVCNKGYTGDGFNCTDVCENYCGDHGKCEYGMDGKPICSCQYGYTGSRCLERDIVSGGLSSAIAGAIAGSVVAVIVIIIISAFCCWRHKSQLKESQNRIYRSHNRLTPAAFYNEGYESTRDSLSNPSQLIVREQDSSSSSGSSLSIAPRWNRCTFANSDEDEMDAYWFDTLQLDDLSLGSDAFSRPPGHREMEHYF